MTGRLRVALDPASVPEGQVLACEVVGGGDRFTAMLQPDYPYDLDLAPGTYVVRANLPSGSVLTAVAMVETDSETQMMLGLGGSRVHTTSAESAYEDAEALPTWTDDDGAPAGPETGSPTFGWGDRGLVEAWRPDVLGGTLFGSAGGGRLVLSRDVVGPDLVGPDLVGPDLVGSEAPRSDEWPESAGSGEAPETAPPDTAEPETAGPETAPPAPEPPPLLPRHQVWARLWLGSLTSTWNDAVSVSEEGAVVVEMSTGVGPYTVQVGGPDVAWRVVCLPPAYGATLRVVASSDPTGFDDGVHVSVTGRSPLAASMLGYLASGQMDAAKIVAPELVAQAKRLFEEKMASPEGAAAAGYFLLRVGQQETIGDWPENFANWFGWLPDAQVIHAAQLLRRPGAPERDLARARLLDAVAAGIPRYTEGVRVLLESLQALAGQEPADQAVADALAEARRYAAACDWSAVHTTYWAVRPGEPTLERPTGWPSDPSGWVELPSAPD